MCKSQRLDLKLGLLWWQRWSGLHYTKNSFSALKSNKLLLHLPPCIHGNYIISISYPLAPYNPFYTILKYFWNFFLKSLRYDFKIRNLMASFDLHSSWLLSKDWYPWPLFLSLNSPFHQFLWYPVSLPLTFLITSVFFPNPKHGQTSQFYPHVPSLWYMMKCYFNITRLDLKSSTQF